VDNVSEIMGIENVDGVLVGSASLSAHDFCEMIAVADQFKS
jgi:triosephosphate isomerase